MINKAGKSKVYGKDLVVGDRELTLAMVKALPKPYHTIFGRSTLKGNIFFFFCTPALFWFVHFQK